MLKWYLVNKRMRIKRDIGKGQLCTRGGGGGSPSEFSVGVCRPVLLILTRKASVLARLVANLVP